MPIIYVAVIIIIIIIIIINNPAENVLGFR